MQDTKKFFPTFWYPPEPETEEEYVPEIVYLPEIVEIAEPEPPKENLLLKALAFCFAKKRVPIAKKKKKVKVAKKVKKKKTKMVYVDEHGNNVEVDQLAAPQPYIPAPDGPINDMLAGGITPRFVDTVGTGVDVLSPDPPKFIGNPRLNDDSFGKED